jgi:ATP-dependent DNA helicase HFM1/MER3
LNKVVLGFKSNGNDFNFEKMLNFKVLEIIRNYSYGGGALIFCQTQKGTE